MRSLLPLSYLFLLITACNIYEPEPIATISDIAGTWCSIDTSYQQLIPGQPGSVQIIDTTRFTFTSDSVHFNSRSSLLTQPFPAHIRHGAILKDSTYTDIRRHEVFTVRYYEEPVTDSLFDIIFRIDSLRSDTLDLSQIEHDSLIYRPSQVTKYNETAKVIRSYSLIKQ
jgi:hypothetical protein